MTILPVAVNHERRYLNVWPRLSQVGVKGDTQAYKHKGNNWTIASSNFQNLV